MSYSKLDSALIASTIWRAPDPVRLLWITILAIKDKDGIVEGSIPGLADLARISVEECRAAIEELCSPDPDSRTKALEGRRLVVENGRGWFVVNHEKFRDLLSAEDKRERDAERQRRRYNRLKSEAEHVTQDADQDFSRPHVRTHAENGELTDSRSSDTEAVSVSKTDTKPSKAKHKPPAAIKKPDEISVIFGELLGYAPSPSGGREWNTWMLGIRSLNELEATPEQVRERFAEYRSRWPNINPPRPHNLADHWQELSIKIKQPKATKTGRDAAQERSIDLLARRFAETERQNHDTTNRLADAREANPVLPSGD